jgi:inosose dehydratase
VQQHRDEAARRAALLRRYGLQPAGGFVPVLLHEPGADQAIERALDDLAATGAQVLVLAAATGASDYETRPELDAIGWAALLRTLDRAAARATDRGLIATLHPHVGTLVEGPEEVSRVLDRSVIGLCLDSGHLLIGGTDPAALAAQAASRVAHVHLKDVNDALAAQVQAGGSYAEAVAKGLYRPLGQGDVDIAGLIAALRRADYEGWYVLEQDTVLPDNGSAGAALPGPGPELHDSALAGHGAADNGAAGTARPDVAMTGTGPTQSARAGGGAAGPAADVRASLAYLRALP